jgi:hypothetical protein
MKTLYAHSFPHIIDQVFNYAEDSALVALRALSRDFLKRTNKTGFTPVLLVNANGVRTPGGDLPSPPTRCNTLIATNLGYVPVSIPVAVRHLILVIEWSVDDLQNPARTFIRCHPELLEINPTRLTMVVKACELTAAQQETGDMLEINSQILNWIQQGVHMSFIEVQNFECGANCKNCHHFKDLKYKLTHWNRDYVKKQSYTRMNFFTMPHFARKIGPYKIALIDSV